MNTLPRPPYKRRRYGGTGRIRLWRCTGPGCIYCPIHHDCTCGLSGLVTPVPSCPLHGDQTTHPNAEELVA